MSAASPAGMPPACRYGSCRWAPSELDDLLGHDLIGHKTRNLLMRAGLVTATAVASKSDADLLALTNFGVACLARVRERFPAPAEAVAS